MRRISYSFILSHAMRAWAALMLLYSPVARGELDDVFFTQRVGLTESRGSLAKEYRRLGLQTTLSRSFKSYPMGIPTDFANEISFYTDSFLTRGPDTLYFPVSAHSKATVLEPGLGYDVCLFSMSLVRACLSAGLTLVHLQTGSLNYQMYVGLPAGARLVYVPYDSRFIWEIGTRYRAFQNRTDGFANKHEDLFTYISLGLASIQSR